MSYPEREVSSPLSSISSHLSWHWSAADREDHAAARVKTETHPGTGKGAGKSHCVLVVDDEPYIVEFLAFLLEEEGYEVLRACDGHEAWELARRVHPDLIISDVMMPRMSGLDLLNRLRDSRELECTPVILMSAVSRPGIAEDVTFLPKPFDIDRILDLVTAELAVD